MTSIGDIVTGRGSKSKSNVDIVVDNVGYDDTFVSGRVIIKGRLTNRRETITTKPMFDIFTNREIPGGWRPSDTTVTLEKSLSAMIKDMDVDDILNIDKQAHVIDTCRSIAARIAVNQGRVYTVNRTPEGCTITRKA